MSISLDKALGIHQHTLVLRSQRAELLSANLANADTPNFKAMDLDFKALLADLAGERSAQGLDATHPRHLASNALSVGGLAPKYRVPLQPNVDGNTVDTQIEQSAFLQNALEYQASLSFLNSRIRGLRLAIRGE